MANHIWIFAPEKLPFQASAPGHWRAKIPKIKPPNTIIQQPEIRSQIDFLLFRIFFLPPKNMSIGHWEVLTYLRICPNYSKEELLKKFYFLFTRKPHSIERKAPLSLCWISRNPPELRLAFGQISIHTAMQTVCHRKYAMQTRMPRISQTASQAAAFENTQVEK